MLSFSDQMGIRVFELFCQSVCSVGFASESPIGLTVYSELGI